MGTCLEKLFLYYMETLEKAKAEYDNGNDAPLKSIKKVNYIVISDGAPSTFRILGPLRRRHTNIYMQRTPRRTL